MAKTGAQIMYVLVHGHEAHTVHGVTNQEIVEDAWTSAGGRVIRVTLNESPTHEEYKSEGWNEDGEWE